MSQQKVDTVHYNLLKNIKTVPWVASGPIITTIRALIILYTILYMVAMICVKPGTILLRPLYPYYPFLNAVYIFFFPASTILTTISGVDLLYILHMILLSINVEFTRVIYNPWGPADNFSRFYIVINLLFAVVNFIFFFYWSVPNRLFFINTFQIGIELEAQTPYNVLKRIGCIWLAFFIVLISVNLYIPFWIRSNISTETIWLYQESEFYLRYASILIIEYLMYKQTHPLCPYKGMVNFRSLPNIVYISLICFGIFCFGLFIFFTCTQLALDWLSAHQEWIQCISITMSALFFARFYFLWKITLKDILDELSLANQKSNYPRWSWDHIVNNA